MKTKHILFNILTLLLSVFSVQTANAQVVQDALYIFRNDGGFNAFFFGDIDHIEYSKIDTLGVEQDDYVVQEVYALDTLFRIPLNAIDSVAFVTPEKKYKADVFRPDKSIANYIVASDSINWIRLASNTPVALIPKVGDKLLIEERSKLIPDGFVGLVTSVNNGNDGYTVMTGDINPTDVYERLVVKVAAATPKTGNARRRGLFDGTEMEYTTEEPIELPDIDVTMPIQGSYMLTPDGSPIDVSFDGTGSYSFGVSSPRLEYRGFIFIDAEQGYNFNQTTKLDFSTSIGWSFTGSMTINKDIPMKEASFDVGDMKLEAAIGFFANAQITGLSMGYNVKGHINGTLYMEFSDKDVLTVGTVPFQDPFYRYNYFISNDTACFTVSDEGKYTFSAGAFAKIGGKLRLPFIKGDISGKAEGRVEIGAHLNFDAPLITPIFEDADNRLLINTPPIYQKLNRETSISTSIYGKLSLTFRYNNQLWGFNPEISHDLFHFYGLVPDISSIHANYEDIERPYRIKISSPIKRDLITSVPIGFTVFDEDEKQIDEWSGLRFSRETDRTSYSHVFTTLDPIKDEEKTYIVYPRIEYLGYPILVDQNAEVTVDPARIDIEVKELHVGSERGYQDIGVQPNMANVVCTPSVKWLDCTWLPNKNQLTVFWEALPEGVKERRAKILIEGKTSKTNELIIEDSVVVNQWIAYADVNPSKMNFEVKGGKQTATIIDTNISDYQVVTDLPWVHPTLKDNIITVTVDANPDEYARGASNAVMLEGKKPDGESISMPIIYVEQDGTGESHGDEGSWFNASPIQTLKSCGMPMYYGDNPPKVDGIYETNQTISVYSTDDDDDDDDEYIKSVVKFADQAGETINTGMYSVYSDGKEDEYPFMPFNIMGDGKYFTVGQTWTMDSEDTFFGLKLAFSYVLSGEIDGEVIKNLYLGLALGVLDKGEYKYSYSISKDGDGVSNKTSVWAPPTDYDDARSITRAVMNSPQMKKHLQSLIDSILKRKTN